MKSKEEEEYKNETRFRLLCFFRKIKRTGEKVKNVECQLRLVKLSSIHRVVRHLYCRKYENTETLVNEARPKESIEQLP